MNRINAHKIEGFRSKITLCFHKKKTNCPNKIKVTALVHLVKKRETKRKEKKQLGISGDAGPLYSHIKFDRFKSSRVQFKGHRVCADEANQSAVQTSRYSPEVGSELSFEGELEATKEGIWATLSLVPESETLSTGIFSLDQFVLTTLNRSPSTIQNAHSDNPASYATDICGHRRRPSSPNPSP